MKENYFMGSKNEVNRLEKKFDYETTRQQLMAMGYKKGMRFLDIGSGSGSMCRLVSMIDKNNNHIYGVDKDLESIEYSKKYAKKNKNTRIKYVLGNVYKLPFKNNTFDFVWVRFLFEYLKKPMEALYEIKRVLKRGGNIVIGDLDGIGMNNYPIEKKLQTEINLLFKRLSPYGFDPYVGRKLYTYLRKACFSSIRIRLYPYHNIFGKPAMRERINWILKINSALEFLRNQKVISERKSKELQRKLSRYILSRDTFTYSVLIYGRGIKK